MKVTIISTPNYPEMMPLIREVMPDSPDLVLLEQFPIIPKVWDGLFIADRKSGGFSPAEYVCTSMRALRVKYPTDLATYFREVAKFAVELKAQGVDVQRYVFARYFLEELPEKLALSPDLTAKVQTLTNQHNHSHSMFHSKVFLHRPWEVAYEAAEQHLASVAEMNLLRREVDMPYLAHILGQAAEQGYENIVLGNKTDQDWYADRIRDLGLDVQIAYLRDVAVQREFDGQVETITPPDEEITLLLDPNEDHMKLVAQTVAYEALDDQEIAKPESGRHTFPNVRHQQLATERVVGRSFSQCKEIYEATMIKS